MYVGAAGLGPLLPTHTSRITVSRVNVALGNVALRLGQQFLLMNARDSSLAPTVCAHRRSVHLCTHTPSPPP
jgi:hypothetical protein